MLISVNFRLKCGKRRDWRDELKSPVGIDDMMFSGKISAQLASAVSSLAVHAHAPRLRFGSGSSIFRRGPSPDEFFHA